MTRPAPALLLGLALSGSAMLHQGQTADPRSLMNPASFTETAPAAFRALFDTTVGQFIIQVHRDWAPHGADRF
jgi:hypothetical protein